MPDSREIFFATLKKKESVLPKLNAWEMQKRHTGGSNARRNKPQHVIKLVLISSRDKIKTLQTYLTKETLSNRIQPRIKSLPHLLQDKMISLSVELGEVWKQSNSNTPILITKFQLIQSVLLLKKLKSSNLLWRLKTLSEKLTGSGTSDCSKSGLDSPQLNLTLTLNSDTSEPWKWCMLRKDSGRLCAVNLLSELANIVGVELWLSSQPRVGATSPISRLLTPALGCVVYLSNNLTPKLNLDWLFSTKSCICLPELGTRVTLRLNALT
jgi:hypothetical protein